MRLIDLWKRFKRRCFYCHRPLALDEVTRDALKLVVVIPCSAALGGLVGAGIAQMILWLA